MALTENERLLLDEIYREKRYPVVRLELRSTKDKALVSTALPDVHLKTARDTMDEVKARAACLRELEQKGYIRIEYSLFVTVSADYALYYESDIFGLLTALTKEGKNRRDFLFDTPYIKRGRAVITCKGLACINA